MKILLTGVNGYIGTRRLPRLIEAGRTVFAWVHSRYRIAIAEALRPNVGSCI